MKRNYSERTFGYRLVLLNKTKITTGPIWKREVRNGWEAGKQLGFYNNIDAAYAAFERCEADNAALLFDSFGRGVIEICSKLDGRNSYSCHKLVIDTTNGIESGNAGYDRFKAYRKLDSSLKDGSFLSLTEMCDITDLSGRRFRPVVIMLVNDVQGKPAEYRFSRTYK